MALLSDESSTRLQSFAASIRFNIPVMAAGISPEIPRRRLVLTGELSFDSVFKIKNEVFDRPSALNS